MSSSEIEQHLLALVRDFLSDLEREQATRALTISASIERDLGIDSLGRVELFHQIEQSFEVQLPQRVMAEADRLSDLADAIASANPPKKLRSGQYFPALDTSSVDASGAKNCVEVLTEFVRNDGNRPHIYLQDEFGSERIISYQDLDTESSKIAAGLHERDIKQGDTVAIMLPTSAPFFYTFFAVLKIGGIPVPIYPPFRPDQIEEYARREAAILNNAETRLLVTFDQAELLSRILQSFVPTLKDVVRVDRLSSHKALTAKPEISPDDAALIQYTSGSTGLPKGVLLSHRNLLANIRAYGEAIDIKPTDSVVSWLPLYHDMGLIGTWLGSLYHGIPITIMSPLSFLSRPERWLWTIHYHRATLSAAPNFAYELCVRKVQDKAVEGLDLSSWRIAFNGAEAVNPKTIKRFTKRYKPYGFKPEAMFPVYGLAESSVALLFPDVGVEPVIDRIARRSFEEEGRAIPVSTNHDALSYVGCGHAIPRHRVRIVDANGQVVPERQVGILQFKGPSTMRGYYRNPALTQSIMHYGWMDTGDYAYQTEGNVFITGRKKDMIITAGRNLFPEEIEEITGGIPGVRRGCVIAFGVPDEKRGTEKLVIVAESHETKPSQKNKIVEEIIDKVASALGIPPNQVVIVPPKTVPKTSSGKLRRSTCKSLYLEGKLTKPSLKTWQQVLRLGLASASSRVWRGATKVSMGIYTAYAFFLAALMFIPMAISVAILPRRAARSMSRFWMRLYFLLIGCRFKVSGKEHVDSSKTMVYVANHASYIDSLVLLAILPSNVNFVAKKELQNIPILKQLFNKLGHILVERWDVSQSLQDAKNIESSLSSSRSIMIFPEGTFTYATGLRPFKMGAFKFAVDAQVPICPIGLQGTRQILRGEGPWMRPCVVKIIITPPIEPEGTAWKDVTKLHSKVRKVISTCCGEPTIDLVMAGPDEEYRPTVNDS